MYRLKVDSSISQPHTCPEKQEGIRKALVLDRAILSGVTPFFLVLLSSAAFAAGAPSVESARMSFYQALSMCTILLLFSMIYALLFFGFFAFNLLGRILWTRKTECIEKVLNGSPQRSFFLGLVNILGFFILLLLLKGTPVAGLILLSFLSIFLYFTLKGSPALLTILGERISVLIPKDVSAIMKITLGTALCALVSLLPGIGPIMMLLLLITAFGGSILSTFTIERRKGSGEG